ncbi:MAG: efflux RND transporter periplasmic adaptor subunit [Gammaproteobacteria bacterium]
MLPKYTLPSLAVAGFLFGVYTVAVGTQKTPVAEPVAQPATAPFRSFIAGSGIVEAKSENIAIGTPLPGIVQKVAVKVGDKVNAGDILFQIDDREALADQQVKLAELNTAKAGIAEAKAAKADAQIQLKLIEAVSDRRAISTEELEKRRNALLIENSKVASAKAQMKQAEANLAAVRTTLDLLTVRALIDGEILQVNIRPGEFAQSGNLDVPLIMMGNMDQLHIRVDIDENDAWRFRNESRAVAYLRGNSYFHADLQLAWVEPYIVPKKSLTGDSTERVDTRVLQALYSFDRDAMPAYAGQQMDVFIEAPEEISGQSPQKGAP